MHLHQPPHKVSQEEVSKATLVILREISRAIATMYFGRMRSLLVGKPRDDGPPLSGCYLQSAIAAKDADAQLHI